MVSGCFAFSFPPQSISGLPPTCLFPPPEPGPDSQLQGLEEGWFHPRAIQIWWLGSSWAARLVPWLPSSSEGCFWHLCQNPMLLLSSDPAFPAWCSEISPQCFPDQYQERCGGFLENRSPRISEQLTVRRLHCFSAGRFGMAAQLPHSTSLGQPDCHNEC